MSDVRVLSDKPAETLGKRLAKRFAEWRATKAELHEQKHRELYDKGVKRLYDGVLDGIVRNVYDSNPGKFAAWVSGATLKKTRRRKLRECSRSPDD